MSKNATGGPHSGEGPCAPRGPVARREEERKKARSRLRRRSAAHSFTPSAPVVHSRSNRSPGMKNDTGINFPISERHRDQFETAGCLVVWKHVDWHPSDIVVGSNPSPSILPRGDSRYRKARLKAYPGAVAGRADGESELDIGAAGDTGETLWSVDSRQSGSGEDEGENLGFGRSGAFFSYGSRAFFVKKW